MWFDGHKREYNFGYLCAVDCNGICRIAHGHQPGSVNDIGAYYASDLYRRANQYLAAGDKMIADGIFALAHGRGNGPFIVPVCGLLRAYTIAEQRYNDLHSWARSIVEHFFGRLKCLCPMLWRYTFSTENNTNIIVGSCIIVTNIVIKYQHPIRI